MGFGLTRVPRLLLAGSLGTLQVLVDASTHALDGILPTNFILLIEALD